MAFLAQLTYCLVTTCCDVRYSALSRGLCTTPHCTALSHCIALHCTVTLHCTALSDCTVAWALKCSSHRLAGPQSPHGEYWVEECHRTLSRSSCSAPCRCTPAEPTLSMLPWDRSCVTWRCRAGRNKISLEDPWQRAIYKNPITVLYFKSFTLSPSDHSYRVRFHG
jgi:hypothetical protein